MITTVLRAPAAVLVSVCVLASACSRTHADRPFPYAGLVRFDDAGGGAVLHVAVASTDADKVRGLMGVDSLPADAGMAFVWIDPTTSGFWMKDTVVPLSIAFVDRRDRIVTIQDMEPCPSDPCPVYEAGRPFVLAVEANRGWFENHGVGVGDPAVLEPSW
jgi:uncharacterized membrane protein (UPF0127 family)